MNSDTLQEHHAQLGAVLDEAGGTIMVRHYGDALAEHRIVRETGGFIDLSHWGIFRFTGKDTLRFVHGMVSNDVKGLPDGGGNHTCILTNKGRIIADFFIYRSGEALIGICRPGLVSRILQTVSRFIIADKVEPEDLSPLYSLIGFYGPRACELFPEGLPVRPGGNTGFTMHLTSYKERDVFVFHAPCCPGVQYLLAVPREFLAEFWEQIMGKANASGMVPYGHDTLELLRLEDGHPLFGVDFDESNFPNEANLEHTISYKKGCYIGQEIIARIHSMGHVNKFLVGLHPEKEVRSGDDIQSEGRSIGTITSAACSPVLNRFIALGYVKRDFSQPGFPVEIRHEEAAIPATVVETPFVR